MVFFGAMHLL